MGHGQRPRTPPIPSLTLFVKPVLRGETQSSPGTARRAQPRGKEARSSLLWSWALADGHWPLASGFSIAAVPLWCPALRLLHYSQTYRNSASHLPAGRSKKRTGYANLGGQVRRDLGVEQLSPAAGSSPLTWP
ncbi:hypothetical protein V8C26DRAFT_245072 [Trichoderma gracile]